MSYLLRLSHVIVRALPNQSGHGLLDTFTLPMRVWPSDLDVNLHMNNGRYLTLMDLGRADLIVRSGLGPAFLRNRWKPTLGGASIRFRKSLRPFQSFTLTTRMVCWDEKWLYLEQKFEAAENVYAAATVKGLFVGPRGPVPTAEVLEATGLGLDSSPPMPESIRRWNEALTGRLEA